MTRPLADRATLPSGTTRRSCSTRPATRRAAAASRSRRPRACCSWRATRSSAARSDAPTSPGATTTRSSRSLKKRLLPLDDDTRVITGHGPETRIGFEREQEPVPAGTPAVMKRLDVRATLPALVARRPRPALGPDRARGDARRTRPAPRRTKKEKDTPETPAPRAPRRRRSLDEARPQDRRRRAGSRCSPRRARSWTSHARGPGPRRAARGPLRAEEGRPPRSGGHGPAAAPRGVSRRRAAPELVRLGADEPDAQAGARRARARPGAPRRHRPTATSSRQGGEALLEAGGSLRRARQPRSPPPFAWRETSSSATLERARAPARAARRLVGAAAAPRRRRHARAPSRREPAPTLERRPGGASELGRGRARRSRAARQARHRRPVRDLDGGRGAARARRSGRQTVKHKTRSRRPRSEARLARRRGRRRAVPDGQFLPDVRRLLFTASRVTDDYASRPPRARDCLFDAETGGQARLGDRDPDEPRGLTCARARAAPASTRARARARHERTRGAARLATLRRTKGGTPTEVGGEILGAPSSMYNCPTPRRRRGGAVGGLPGTRPPDQSTRPTRKTASRKNRRDGPPRRRRSREGGRGRCLVRRHAPLRRRARFCPAPRPRPTPNQTFVVCVRGADRHAPSGSAPWRRPTRRHVGAQPWEASCSRTGPADAGPQRSAKGALLVALEQRLPSPRSTPKTDG